MGVVVGHAPPTYPDGLPPALLARVEATLGVRVICNRPYNGIAAIEDYGEEHLECGRPILYTSADSVLQLAAHTSLFSAEELYAACAALRAALQGPDAVRRVIARPFEGVPGAFERTLGRRDYTLPPPTPSYLSALREAGVAVHGVGKAAALFDGVGFSAVHAGATNEQAIASLERLIGELDHGLVFANLIETDQIYGHRKDAAGFHAALRLIDTALARWLSAIGDGDLLVITADHGCDPASAHTDHTREHAPLLARFAGHGGRRHDGPLADVGASVLDWLTGTAAIATGSLVPQRCLSFPRWKRSAASSSRSCATRRSPSLRSAIRVGARRSTRARWPTSLSAAASTPCAGAANTSIGCSTTRSTCSCICG